MVYQGRLSISTLSDVRKGLKASTSEDVPQEVERQGRRGWWDYVPEVSQSNFDLRSNHKSSSEQTPRSIKLPKFSYPSSGMTSQGAYRKPSIRGDHPILQPHLREPSVTFSFVQPTRVGEANEVAQLPHRRISSASSVMSRISKYMPRMQLFRKVLKNEVRPPVLAVLMAHCMFTNTSAATLYGFSDRDLPDHGYPHAYLQSPKNSHDVCGMVALRL